MNRLSRRQVMQGLVVGGLSTTLLGRFPFSGIAAPAAMWVPGVLPDPTKPEGTDLLPEIEHIVVLMMENHSFDAYFGMLGRGDGFTIGPNGLPTNANPDGLGGSVGAFPAGSTDQTGFSVRLGWNNVFRQVNSGAMDGFVVNSGLESMAYFTRDEIPFYYGLAQQFPICDRYFCSVPGATYPNRRFLTAATAAGLSNTDVLAVLDNPTAPNGTIFERLDAFGVPWFNYSAGLPEVALWPSYFFANQTKVRPMAEFYESCRAGTLPGFSLVTPALGADEHPPQDIAIGEQFSAGVIQEVLDGPGWEHTVLVFTYDEHGGFYDHVAPPPAVPPGDGIAPIFTGPVDPGAGDYDRYGVRVPTVVVSPFARQNYVSHVVHDHTSILRLIETKWNIGALTDRDASASNLLDTLDFSAPPTEPPALPPPRAGRPDIVSEIVSGDRSVPGIEGLQPHPEPAEAVVVQPSLTG